MSKLKISPGLSLPIETVTESVAILAKRGAGKTYAASVLVEEMLKAKLQVVVLDPMGAWWGLRSSADGKSEGFPVAILGGDKGDVPLEPTGGVVVADLIVGERLPAIVDLSPFSKTERRRFVADFLERLYQRNRDAMHVVLEEADLFAPEGKLKRAGDEAMLGAVYDLVRRGRGRGIGSTLITQRSASLSKEVLTQAEILIALRTTGPHDVAAVKEWIRYHGDEAERDLVLGSLHELPTGEAYVWWPVEGILKRVKIRERQTFDSSATPKAGETRRDPKTVADVDLGALTKQMAATIEKAKSEDPRELRKKLAEAQRALKTKEQELANRPTEAVVEERVVENTVEIPVFKNGEVDRLADAIAALRAVAEQIESGVAIVKAAPRVQGERREEARRRASRPAPARPPARRSAPVAVAPREPALATADDRDVKIGKGELKVMDVLREWPEGKTQNEVAFLAGYSAKASTIGVILSNLRRAGYVDQGQPIRLTDSGMDAAGGPVERATGPALLDEWLRHPRMGDGERRVLLHLVALYPDEPTHEELCEATGYSSIASTMGVILSKLRKLGLVQKGHRQLDPAFYEAIA